MPDEGPRGGDAQPSLRAAPRPPDPDVNGTKRVPLAHLSSRLLLTDSPASVKSNGTGTLWCPQVPTPVKSADRFASRPFTAAGEAPPGWLRRHGAEQ